MLVYLIPAFVMDTGCTRMDPYDISHWYEHGRANIQGSRNLSASLSFATDLQEKGVIALPDGIR